MARKPLQLNVNFIEQSIETNLVPFYATGLVTYLENNIVELKIVSSSFNLERIKNVIIQQIRGNIIETFDYVNVYTIQFENLEPDIVKVFLLNILLNNNTTYFPIKLIVLNETPAEHVCENGINWESDSSILWESSSCIESPPLFLCTPTFLNIPSVSFSGNFVINYRIDLNNELGIVRQYFGNTDIESLSQYLFSYFVFQELFEVGVSVGSGGIANFFSYPFFTGGILNGGDGSISYGLPPSSITINFLTSEDANFQSDIVDFVSSVFNESVSVTSCGLQEWPGL